MRSMKASTGSITPMWRHTSDVGDAIDEDGDLKLVEPDSSEYGTPNDGTKAKLRISGFSEAFELDSQFSDKPEKKVRAEFLVVKVANASEKWVEGSRFTCIYNWTIGPKSNLGKLLGRLRGNEIAPGEEVCLDCYIGTEFVASTSLSASGTYAIIEPAAIEKGKTVLSPLLSANGATPEPVPASDGAADSDEGDPFDDEEL